MIAQELQLHVKQLLAQTRVAEQIDYVETVQLLQPLLIVICVMIIIVTSVLTIYREVVQRDVTELLL